MKKIFLFTSLILITFFSNVFAQPITLSTTNITNTGAQLNWDASPCTGNVTLHYKEVGAAWPGTIVNPATSPEILTGLAYNTDYEWRVKCSGSGNPWSPIESFSTTSPTIANAFISYPIQCYGIYNTDSMQIDIAQTTPPTTYACVVGTINGAGFFLKFVSTNQTTTTQISLNGFNPNVDYYVRLVDSTAYFSANPNGNGTSNAGIYDEFGPINFSEPAQLTAQTSVVSSNLCAGDCIAEEDLTISGGTMPYSFDITSSSGTTTQNLGSGISSYSFAALCADTYDILVTDANGCSTSPPITSFSIAPISPISVSGTVSPVSCFGGSDGEINASATGGAGGFTYSIDGINFQTDPQFDNLSQGIYTVTYKDQNDCIATEVLVVNQPPDLSGIANVTNSINCYGANTGEITFFVDPVNSGTPGYQYSIDGGITLQSSNVFTSLVGDSTYNVMIQDNNGCQFISTVFLAQPAEITYSTTLSNYNGFEVSCFGASDGEINTAATGGTGAISYSIDGTNFQISGVFSALVAGGYTVTYQDGNGCTPTDQVLLNEPGDFTIPFTFSNAIDCPGDCNGAISINPSNGVGTVLYSLDAGTQQTTPSFSGLCGNITHGSYTLDAIDDNGCTATIPVSVSEPGPFVYTTSSISETCSPPNGEASISVTSGGTGAYAYLWDDPNTQTTPTASGLVAGTYQVTVTDGNLCSFTETVVVTSAPLFSLSFTTISPCLGPLSGSATVSVSGGASGTLSYVWSDNNGTPVGTGATLDNVAVGTYSVDVTDGSGCTISGSVNITPPINPIMFDTLIITNNSCYGIDDAQIEIIVSGGQQPYSYSNGFPPAQSNPVFVYLAPNSYTITATDFNNCYVDTVIDIVYPGLLQIDSTYFTNVSCNGANDAEILAIDVSGGTAPFEYSVDGSTHYSNMSYFNGYGPGTYTVEVYDANNCVGADYIIITEPAELDVDITTSGWVYNPNSGLYSYQIKCYGDNSGFADLVINGGTAPYTRNLYDATTGLLITSTNLNSFTGLTAGEYHFEVVDANGCIYSETILFSQPPPITHSFIPTHVTCSGWSNGSLTDIVSGGVGDATSYIYSWNTGDSTYTLDSIAVGVYTMTVTDENNCLSVASFAINDNDMLAVSSASENVSCYDYCDGEISAIVVGGLPNYDANGNPIYTYQWNDILLQTTQTAIGLCADNNADSTEYNCVITDGQGCIVTIEETIYQPDSLHVSAIITSDYNFADISCYGANDGKLKATAIGGTPGYSYAWTGPGNYTGTGANAIGLVAGSYIVVATDLNGCLDTTEITLTEPAELTISVSQTNVNCFGIYDGQIIANADGGTPFNGIPPMYDYSFSSGFNEQIDVSTDINLGPGIYTVTATDQNGCSITSGSIFISQPTDPLIIDLDSIDENCTGNNGVVISTVDGGTPPYNYNWNDGWSTLDILYDLDPGIYFVEVIDDNDCVVFDTIRVVGKDEVFLPGNISSFDTTVCLGENFELNIQEKLGFRYIWEHENAILLEKTIENLANDHADIIVFPDNDTNIYTLTIIDTSCAVSDIFQVQATIYTTSIDPQITSFPGLEYGNYPVVLKGSAIELASSPTGTPATPPFTYNWTLANDTIGNSNLITVNDLQESSTYYLVVQDSEGCLGFDSIYVVVGVLPYEAITPNGDGYNDTWTPLDITSYENALVQVFNRWGALVFESKGGSNYQAWDGSNNGEELPVGTYYYIIDLNTGDEPQTGPITIIR